MVEPEGNYETVRLDDSFQTMLSTLNQNDQAIKTKEKENRATIDEAQQVSMETEERKNQTLQKNVLSQTAESLVQVVQRISSAAEELSARFGESIHGTQGQRNRAGETATAMDDKRDRTGGRQKRPKHGRKF